MQVSRVTKWLSYCCILPSRWCRGLLLYIDGQQLNLISARVNKNIERDWQDVLCLYSRLHTWSYLLPLSILPFFGVSTDDPVGRLGKRWLKFHWLYTNPCPLILINQAYCIVITHSLAGKYKSPHLSHCSPQIIAVFFSQRGPMGKTNECLEHQLTWAWHSNVEFVCKGPAQVCHPWQSRHNG